MGKRYRFKQIPVPAPLAELGAYARAYRMRAPDGDETQVFVGREPVGIIGQTEDRWHLSISGRGRLPRWSELKAARDEFIPAEVFMAIPMPPKAYWLNVHPYVLHIWEYRDQRLTDQMMAEATEAWREGLNRPYGVDDA